VEVGAPAKAWHPALFFLGEQQIEHPAAADVGAGTAAMLEDFCVGASGFFNCVCEDRQRSEVAFSVNGLRDLGHSLISWYAMQTVFRFTKRITKDVPYEDRLGRFFDCLVSDSPAPFSVTHFGTSRAGYGRTFGSDLLCHETHLVPNHGPGDMGWAEPAERLSSGPPDIPIR
jgi:hypothetical protein